MDSLGVSTRLCAGIEFESSCMSLLNRSSDGLQMSDVDTIYLNNLRQVLDHVERSVNPPFSDRVQNDRWRSTHINSSSTSASERANSLSGELALVAGSGHEAPSSVRKSTISWYLASRRSL
jgi:hypothetical protein